MPLTRYQIRNEYGLADAELHRAASKDDPEALLEGVAMAGLVGILRQLGDLAEFAAEMFHDLHEEVMSTAARGHGLMFRVQQLEAEFPNIEKAFLSQTDHSSFFSNAGMEWHPNLQMQQNMITRGDLPRCVMDSYEECRGPPRLFLLDKFDVAGAGASLKRYTDPSFFRLDTPSSETLTVETQREKKSRKVKKKGSRWRNGGTPDIAPTSHAKLHQLFLEERVDNGHTDPARLVKLKTRKLNGSPFNSKSGRSYMEKFLQTPSSEHKRSSQIDSNPQLLTWKADDSRDSGIEISEISMVGDMEKSYQGTETEASSTNEQEVVPNPHFDNINQDVIDRDIETVTEPTVDNGTNEIPSHRPKMITEKELGTDRKGRSEDSLDRNYSEDLASEVDNYVDALATMESEMETDNEGRPSNESRFLNVGKRETDSVVDEEQMEIPPQFSDSQSIGNTSASDNGYSSFGKGRSSFSYSDTVSMSTENEPSDGEAAAEQLPSTGTCEGEMVDSSFNHLPATKHAPGSDSHDLESVSGRDADNEEASRSSYCTSSSPSSLPQDTEACSQMVQPLAPELVETSSDYVRLGPEKLSIAESKMNLNDSSTSDVYSQVALDGGDLSLSSKALKTKLPDFTLVEKGCSVDVDDVLQTNHADDNHSENLVNVEQFPRSARPETEISRDDVVPEVGGPIPEAEIHSEDISPLTAESDNILGTKEVPQVDMEILVTELTGEIFSVGTETDETIAVTSEVNFKKKTSMVTEVDDSTLTSEINSEENKSMADDEGLGNQVVLDDVAPETVAEEKVAVSNTDAADAGENTNNVCLSSNSNSSPSERLMDMQESFSGAEELHQPGLKSNWSLPLEYHSESETESPTNPLEVASADSDSMPLEPVSDIPFSQEVSDDVHVSPPTEPNSKPFTVGDALTIPRSSNQGDIGPETRSHLQSNILNNGVDALSSGACNLPERETPLEQFKAPQLIDMQASEGISESMNLESEKISCLDHKDQEYVNASPVPCEALSSEALPQSVDQEVHSSKKEALNLGSALPSFGLHPEATQTNMDAMPPLPPLPPMQWRIGKVQHAVPLLQKASVENSQTPFPAMPPFAAEKDGQFRSTVSDEDAVQSVEEGKKEKFVGNMVQASPSHLPTTFPDLNSQLKSSAFEGTPSTNLFLTSPAVSNQRLEQDYLSPESNIVQSTSTSYLPEPSAKNATVRHNLVSSQEMLARPLNQLASEEDYKAEEAEHILQNSGESNHTPGTMSLMLPKSTKVEEKHQLVLSGSEGETVQPSNLSTSRVMSSSVDDAMWPVNAFALAPNFDTERPNEKPTVKLPRPRSPLVDAVAAHDRSTMRKVSERVRSSMEPEMEEKDSLLAQIRNKSFNLKPAVVTRPSIQVGPKTNLKVAAILEKAITIRQAMAGSDEDEDSDSWSDS